MISPSFKKAFSKTSSLAALSVLSVVLASCGGGSGDDGPPTRRPKSLDGLILTFDSNVTFEFVRNMGTPAAIRNGDIETGTFFYTLGGVQIRQYPNANGDNSDSRWPDSITGASYTYEAINDDSAVLTLTGTGVNDLNDTGSFNANNGSFAFFFNRGSDSATTVLNQVQIDIAFSSTGRAISSDVVTAAIVGSTNLFDTVRIPSTIQLASGGSVPENYNPTIDPNRESRIVPASLANLEFRFTNPTNADLSFSVQFAADTTSGNLGSNVDEIGTGLMRINGVAIPGAIDYTWTRIGGTDTARLVMEGSNSTLDGTMTLTFAGSDNGSYAGNLDDITTDPNDVTGTFIVLTNP